MKGIIFAAALSCCLGACHQQQSVPKQMVAEDATVEGVEVRLSAEYLKEHAEYVRTIQAAQVPAPEDFRTKRCIYVARWNAAPTYDAAYTIVEGGAYDGGAFAYLGAEGDIIKVAAPNARAEALDLYPEAKDEPKWIVLHFQKDQLSFDQKKTAWVQAGQDPINDGECKH